MGTHVSNYHRTNLTEITNLHVSIIKPHHDVNVTFVFYAEIVKS